MATGRGQWMPYRSGMPRGGYGQLRASDADRERTADVLKGAYVEGRLTKDELDARLEQTYAARTYADLGGLTADLPVAPRPPAPAAHRPRPAPSTNNLAVASLFCALTQVFSLGLTAIPAIILGHRARAQIRQTGQRGDGLALAGLVLGWLGIAFIVLLVVGLTTAAAGGMHVLPHGLKPPPGP